MYTEHKYFQFLLTLYALSILVLCTHNRAKIPTFVLPTLFRRTYNCSTEPKFQNIRNKVIQQIMRVKGCIVDPSEIKKV